MYSEKTKDSLIPTKISSKLTGKSRALSHEETRTKLLIHILDQKCI